MSDLADLILTSMAMLSIALTAVVSNLLIIVAVLWNKRIRSIANVLFVNLAVADFFQGLVSIPLRLTEQLNRTATRPLVPCLVVIPLVIFFYSASNLNITIISVDRFIALYKPMHYKSIVTPSTVGVVITGCWGIALAVALTPIVTGWGAKDNVHLIDICLFSTTMQKEYLFMLFSIINFFVLVILAVTNIYILKTARNQIRRIHIAKMPTFDATDAMSTVNQTPDSFQVSTAGSQRSIMSFASFKNRAKAHRLRHGGRERRATKVVLIIVGLFVVLTVPITMIDLLNVFEANVTIPLVIIKIAVFMVYGNACFNVFIYAGYNQDMRDTFQLMYTKLKCYLRRS